MATLKILSAKTPLQVWQTDKSNLAFLHGVGLDDHQGPFYSYDFDIHTDAVRAVPAYTTSKFDPSTTSNKKTASIYLAT